MNTKWIRDWQKYRCPQHRSSENVFQHVHIVYLLSYEIQEEITTFNLFPASISRFCQSFPTNSQTDGDKSSKPLLMTTTVNLVTWLLRQQQFHRKFSKNGIYKIPELCGLFKCCNVANIFAGFSFSRWFNCCWSDHSRNCSLLRYKTLSLFFTGINRVI